MPSIGRKFRDRFIMLALKTGASMNERLIMLAAQEIAAAVLISLGQSCQREYL